MSDTPTKRIVNTETQSERNAFLEHLETPAIVTAVHSISDNVGFIAFAVTAIDDLMQRGTGIIEAIADRIRDIKASLQTQQLDFGTSLSLLLHMTLLRKTAAQLAKITQPEEFQGLLQSETPPPETLRVAGKADDALAVGKAMDVKIGLLGLSSTIQTTDVQKLLEFFITAINAFGRKRNA